MINHILPRSSPVTTKHTGNVCAAMTSLIRAIALPVRLSSDIVTSPLPKYRIIHLNNSNNLRIYLIVDPFQSIVNYNKSYEYIDSIELDYSHQNPMLSSLVHDSINNQI
jgi:hypothetical protein